MRVTFPVTLNLLSFMTLLVQLENYVENRKKILTNLFRCRSTLTS